MASLTLTTKRTSLRGRNVVLKINAAQFERFAASLGFFNPDFLLSLDRAERDHRAGRYRKVASLKSLHRGRRG